MQNHLEIKGLTTTTDLSTVLTAVLQSIPVENIVCAARSNHISNTSSTYFIFLNTSELCSFNLDALRLIKAPTDEATYEFRTTLSGSTCSKFALPSPRDSTKTPAWQTPQQLLMPQPPPPPPPRVQMHQVQPDVLPHVETVEQLVPMVKVLLVEMQTRREENKLLSDKIDILTDLIRKVDIFNETSTNTIQSTEQISPTRKKSGSTPTSSAPNIAEMSL